MQLKMIFMWAAFSKVLTAYAGFSNINLDSIAERVPALVEDCGFRG